MRSSNSPKKSSGATAPESLFRGERQFDLPPLLFLDFDDVICLSRQYGGYDCFSADPPADLWETLWHPPAVQTLQAIVAEYRPQVVLTTSWLRLSDDRTWFESLFKRTGLEAVANVLHEHWDAPQERGDTRLQAIERWLSRRYEGERIVVLDDAASGTGLSGSRLDATGCVVLCEVGVGLHAGHLKSVELALRSQRQSVSGWP